MSRPKTKRKITRLSVSLDDRDYQAVRDLAAAYDVSTAWIMRRAVAAYLASANAEGSNDVQARHKLP